MIKMEVRCDNCDDKIKGHYFEVRVQEKYLNPDLTPVKYRKSQYCLNCATLKGLVKK